MAPLPGQGEGPLSGSVAGVETSPVCSTPILDGMHLALVIDEGYITATCSLHVLEVGPLMRPAFFRPILERGIVATRDVFSVVWPLAEEVAISLGFELVEIERGGGQGRIVIRLFIDKPGGVDLADCSRMSRELNQRLEEGDLIEVSYVLEVSSPGLERPLRKAADFERYAGSPVELRLYKPDGESGRKQYTGTLLGIEGETVTIEIEGGEKRSFPLDGISRARLRVDWDTVFQDKPQSGEVNDGGLYR